MKYYRELRSQFFAIALFLIFISCMAFLAAILMKAEGLGAIFYVPMHVIFGLGMACSGIFDTVIRDKVQKRVTKRFKKGFFR